MSAREEAQKEVAAYESPIKFCRVAKFNSKPRPLECVVDGMLLKDSVAGVVAPPAAFKTLLIADICASVSTGTPWFDRKVAKGSAIILLGEGNQRLFRRFQAIEKLRGISFRKAPLYVSNRLDNFLLPEAVMAVGDKIARGCDKIGLAPSIICIDPLAYALSHGDENSASDMSRVMGNISEHLRGRFGCAVLVVHHTGHSNTGRARGSAAFKASLDTEIVMTRNGYKVRMECTKQKDMQEFLPVTLIAKTVVVDKKAEEESTGSGTSLAFTSASFGEALTQQGAALACLKELCGDKNKLVPTASWKREVLDRGIATSDRSYEHFKERLAGRGKIEVVGKAVRVV